MDTETAKTFVATPQIRSKSTAASVYRDRERKWLQMMRGPGGLAGAHASNQATVKRRCRKGIPEAVRGSAWLELSGAAALKLADAPGAFSELCGRELPAGILDHAAMGVGLSTSSTLHTPAPLESAEGAARRAVFDTIERDIARTFTGSAFFSSEGSAVGQRKLFRVLVAYAQLHPEIGYCQGMAFVVSLVLSFMGSEEDAFATLRVLMSDKRYALAGLFAPGLPLVDRHLHTVQGLLNKLRPRLAAKLLDLGLHASMFAAQWIITLFAYSLPLPLVARVFDSFVVEGFKLVFRVSIQLLATFEVPLMACTSLEEAMAVFKLIPEVLAGNHAEQLPNSSGHSERAAVLRHGGAGVARVIGLMPVLSGSAAELDAFLARAFALPFSRSDLALLEREHAALVAAHCETCGGNAGSLLKRGGASRLPVAAQAALGGARTAVMSWRPSRS